MAGFLLMLIPAAINRSATADDRPNIVLIMCDDMGFSDLGCYGGEVLTPNLDRLAREGLRMTQFYNNAKCTTTRASILTGLYPRFGQGGHLRQNMITLGEAMRLAGYNTSLSGKWHLLRAPGGGKSDEPGGWVARYDKTTHPFFRGFDSYYGVLDGCCNFFDPAQRDPDYKGGNLRKFGRDDQAVTQFPADYYTTDAFTDHAIGMIRTFCQDSKPFFIHVCYTCPHYPIQARPEDIQRYIGRFKMGWQQMRRDRWQRQQQMGLAAENWQLTETDSHAYSWETADQPFEDLRMAVYAAMIDRMDKNIGRLLDALREGGADQNTLIMFLSDNGGCTEEPGGRDPQKRVPGPASDYVAVGPAWGWAQNAPFRRYKSWLHEGGITTPLIAWFPGHISANRIDHQPAHIIDLLPTFLDFSQTSYPAEYAGHQLLPLEGHTIRPLLEGHSQTSHSTLAWFWAQNRAIRQGDWKLVWDKRVRRWELYDLGRDRCETTNLASEDPDRVQQMAADWFAWSRSMELKVEEK